MYSLEVAHPGAYYIIPFESLSQDTFTGFNDPVTGRPLDTSCTIIHLRKTTGIPALGLGIVSDYRSR